jgi:hypothetical protein
MLMAPFYFAVFSRFAAAAQSGVAPPLDIPDMMRAQAVGYLVGIGGAFIRAVLFCAVWRAVLHPEQRRLGYVRIGAAELFVFLLIIVVSIVLVASMLMVVVPGAIIVALLAANNAAAAAAIIGVVGCVALIVGAIYVALRFSLAGPMIVDVGKFRLFESWTLTKGHVGGLLAVALCLVAIILVGEMTIGAVILGVGANMLGAAAGGVQTLTAFFSQAPSAFLPKLAPLLTLLAIIAIPIAGCAIAIVGAPWARAYRDLAAPDMVGPIP